MKSSLLTITLLFNLLVFPSIAQQNLVIQSPLSTTPGTDNTLIGEKAGFNITSGKMNTFIGSLSGQNTTTGSYNIFLGRSSGEKNTEGRFNTFIGVYAGGGNTVGSSNTFIGTYAGTNNITGIGNLFIGSGSGNLNTRGENNVFLGAASGSSNISGTQNVFIGVQAGLFNTSGNYNVCLGYIAGSTNKTGTRNTLIGNESDLGFDNLTNATAIGNRSIVSISNAIVLGDTTSGIKVGIGTTAPQFPLDVKGTINIRGVGGKLKFTHLTNPNFNKEGNDQFLTVNKQGEVTLTKYRLQITQPSEWSDRVFSKSYTLAPLEQVEQFIKTHQHLPGIPSAQEVTENGIDATQFNAKLLEKIEELTLYMIESRKENQELKRRLEQVEAENKLLQQRSKQLNK